MRYIKRELEQLLFKYLDLFPVVALTGPRQSGKSTLIRHALPHYVYVTFDDPKLVSYFHQDPEGFMQTYSDQVIFDEVQQVPELFSYLKMAVDQDRQRYGKFIVTGSSQFSLLQKISESLAGRIGLLSLLPFSCNEMPANLRQEAVYRGAYPELVVRDFVGEQEWYASYLNTYLSKDVRAILNVTDLTDFQRLIELLAANAGQILNMSTYARDLGVTVQTIKRWLSVLEASYIIFLLKPYYKNYGKRITKSSKVYFYDTGLVSYLCGISTRELYEKGPMLGAIFENYIVSEINKKQLYLGSHAALYYFRDSAGHEVDLIVDFKQARHLIEIKHTSSFRPAMIDSIRTILESHDKAFLLYNGKDFPFHSPFRVVNYQDYLLKHDPS